MNASIDQTRPIDAAIGLLACPVCVQPLTRADRVLRCAAGHSFDLARQGHVNLLRHVALANADTADMVAARERFLTGDHYSPIRSAVVAAAGEAATVIEVGAGTGYYLAGVLAAGAPDRHLGLDISVPAARRAARAGLAMAVADTWQGLPVLDRSVAAVLCVFAPRNPGEFARVLAPGGQVLVVTPTTRHLGRLRSEFGLLTVPADKTARLDQTLALAGLQLVGRNLIEFELHLIAGQTADLVAMGPNAFHRDRMLSHPRVSVSAEPPGGSFDDLASVHLSRYRRPSRR